MYISIYKVKAASLGLKSDGTELKIQGLCVNVPCALGYVKVGLGQGTSLAEIINEDAICRRCSVRVMSIIYTRCVQRFRSRWN